MDMDSTQMKQLDCPMCVAPILVDETIHKDMSDDKIVTIRCVNCDASMRLPLSDLTALYYDLPAIPKKAFK